MFDLFKTELPLKSFSFQVLNSAKQNILIFLVLIEEIKLHHIKSGWNRLEKNGRLGPN